MFSCVPIHGMDVTDSPSMINRRKSARMYIQEGPVSMITMGVRVCVCMCLCTCVCVCVCVFVCERVSEPAYEVCVCDCASFCCYRL